MINNQEKILSGESEEIYPTDIEGFKRLIDLQKQYFSQMHRHNIDFSIKGKDAAKLYRYSLPTEINELFLRIEEAPVYWLCETKLNHYLHDFFKNHYPPVNGIDQIKYFRDFYTKWLMIKQHVEKKYFGSTAISFLERNSSKHNFHAAILCGIIFSYDVHLRNYSRAIELFNKAKETIHSIKLNEHYREEIEYLIILYSGFAAINNNEYETAKEYFLNALILKPEGITAKFHLALIETKLSCFQSADYLIKEILHFDMKRIKYAVENSNLSMFDYFIHNSILSKIFYYSEFSSLAELIENMFSSIEGSNINSINDLKKKSEIFKQLNNNQGYKEEIANQLLFIWKLAEDPNRNKNLLFINNGQNLQNHFNLLIDNLRKSIKENHYSKINEQLVHFDSEISFKNSYLEELTKEYESAKAGLKSKLEAEIKSFEKKINQEIMQLEDKVKNLANESQFNPKNAFNKTMTYNIIISFLSSFMGGCAGYSSSSVTDVMELKSLLSAIIISGIKWGLIAFAVGFIVSSGSAAYALAERSNRKQALLQKISSLKNEGEHSIGLLKKEADRKEKKLIQNYNDELNLQKELIQKLLDEKEKQKNLLIAEAEKAIAEEIKPLEDQLI